MIAVFLVRRGCRCFDACQQTRAVLAPRRPMNDGRRAKPQANFSKPFHNEARLRFRASFPRLAQR